MRSGARGDRRIRRLAAGVALALLAARALVALEPGAALTRDYSTHLYFAQATADGVVLYRDVYSTKTPLAALTGSVIVRGADRAGIEPVLALRVTWMLLALLPWALLTAWACSSARSLALVALPLAALLGWNFVWSLPALGVTPKTLVVACSAAMLLAIEARAWFWCGVLASLGFLDWQIGGLLLPAAAIAAWASRANARALARLGGGFAFVLAAVTGWFALSHAAADLWRTTVIDVAASEWMALDAASFGRRVEKLVGVLRQTEHASLALPATAQLVAVAACAWIGLRRRDPVAAFAGVYAGAMTALAFIDMDGPGDLYAYVAAGLLALFVAAARSRFQLRGPIGDDRIGAVLIAVVATAGLGWAAMHRLATRAPEPFGIAQQRELARRLFAVVPPERVASEGFPELHVLVRRVAPGPFLYFSANAWRSLRRGDEAWRATAARLLAPTAIDAAIIGRSHSWDGEFPFEELAAGSPPPFVVRTISLGPLCYTLLVKSAAPLAARLSDTAPCPP